MLGSHDDDYIAKSEDSTNRRGRPTFLPVLYSLIFPPTTSVCSIAFPWWGCLNFLKRELIFRNMLVATIGFLFCWLQNRRWCVGYLAERRPISPLIQKIGFGSHLNCRRQKKPRMVAKTLPSGSYSLLCHFNFSLHCTMWKCGIASIINHE